MTKRPVPECQEVPGGEETEEYERLIHVDHLYTQGYATAMKHAQEAILYLLKMASQLPPEGQIIVVKAWCEGEYEYHVHDESCEDQSP